MQNGVDLEIFEKNKGFFCIESNLFLCIECAIKWSQYKWDDDLNYK
jgi:hypothetical protein